jgi:hypothetical protein
MSQESYENLVSTYDDLTAPKPAVIDHDQLLGSLETMNRTGTKAVRENEVGVIRFASEMTERYTGALALNERGLVQPPLTGTDIEDINAKIDSLSVLLHANGEATDTQAAPTDTSRDGFNTHDQK